MKISFSHNYPKLYGQKYAKLVAVQVHNRDSFSDNLINYDTKYEGGEFYLPPSTYMVLLFWGNDLIPFTTIRRWTPEKATYYTENIGSVFDVNVKKD